MKKIALLFFALFISNSYSQITLFDEDDSTYAGCSNQSFDIGLNNTGISFGNSSYFNGIRFNFVDCGIEEINGINITFWQPERNPGSVINGMAIGLAPSAGVINGISIGLGAVVAEKDLHGII